jgi:peroxiredoxin
MDIGTALTALGLLLVVGAVVAYLLLLFVVHGFTYRTWRFHVTVIAGVTLAVAGWLAGGSGPVALLAIVAGVTWFVVTWRELRLVGSTGLAVRPGDAVPRFAATTVEGAPFTDGDLVSDAPALLVLYRGWWCPSSRAQLDEIVRRRGELTAAGVSVFAGSVDSPAEAAPMQDHLGPGITVLCDVPTSLLDAIGIRDTRGAPWYDRLIFGAACRDISMPDSLLVDGSGRIRYVHRSSTVDDRPLTSDVLASI